MFVGLKKGWPTSYRRTVREPKVDEKGRKIGGFTVKKTLVFNPREMVEITDPEELKAIASALAKGVLEEKVPKERVELKGPTEPPAPETSTSPPEPGEVSAVADAFAGVDDETPLDIEDKTHEHVSRHSRKR